MKSLSMRIAIAAMVPAAGLALSACGSSPAEVAPDRAVPAVAAPSDSGETIRRPSGPALDSDAKFWSAIAYSPGDSVVGLVVDHYGNDMDAEYAAISDCESNGGQACELGVVSKHCVALVFDAENWSGGYGSTVSEAVKDAHAYGRQGGFEIVDTEPTVACTRPQQRRLPGSVATA